MMLVTCAIKLFVCNAGNAVQSVIPPVVLIVPNILLAQYVGSGYVFVAMKVIVPFVAVIARSTSVSNAIMFIYVMAVIGVVVLIAGM